MALKRLRNRAAPAEATPTIPTEVIDGGAIPDNDPLFAYLLATGGPVEVERIAISSPALDEIRSQGIQLIVPLISQGELIGTLSLGRRLSEQPYSTDDRKLLAGLAGQVAPAIRVAQLVRQQEAEAKERERIDQELRVARSDPANPAAQGVAPSRRVGNRGLLPVGPGSRWRLLRLHSTRGGRIGLVIGDVTDKGVPAALVMATTRSTLRSIATQHDDPGEVLALANESLVPEIPPAMFVTCLYGVLESGDRRAHFCQRRPQPPLRPHVPMAYASSAPVACPLVSCRTWSTKSPKAQLDVGETVLLTSDGIVEAHDAGGEMFGFQRLMDLVGREDREMTSSPRCSPTCTISAAPTSSKRTTSRWSQSAGTRRRCILRLRFGDEPGLVANFTYPSNSGNERVAMDEVSKVVGGLGLAGDRLERLKTAVSEAAMNAIEHGNHGDPEKLVESRGPRQPRSGSWFELGTRAPTPVPKARIPNLEAKLAGEQSPRGWGLFLIEKMVDAMRTTTDDGHHTVELEMSREGE